MKNEILKFSLALFAICFFSSLSLSLANFFTREKIAFQKYIEEENALQEVMPEAEDFKPVKKNGQTLYYIAYKDGDIIGYCFMARKRGYSSIIETMVGMDRENRISGIKIVSQNETPGLGAKIVELEGGPTLLDVFSGKRQRKDGQKPWFEKRFIGKDVGELDKVDTISAATISSSAVIKSVREKAEEIISLLKLK